MITTMLYHAVEIAPDWQSCVLTSRVHDDVFLPPSGPSFIDPFLPPDYNVREPS